MTSQSERILDRLTEVRDAYLAFRSEAEPDLALSRAMAAVFDASERESVAAFLAGHEPDDVEHGTDGAEFREELLAQLEGYRERVVARAAATTGGWDPGDGDVVACPNGHHTSAGSFCDQCAAPLQEEVVTLSDLVTKPSTSWWSRRSSGQRAWIIVGSVIVGLMVFGSISGDSSPSRTSGTASRSTEDASARAACRHFRNVTSDIRAGTLTQSEIRQKFQEVWQTARGSDVSSIRYAAQGLLAAQTRTVEGGFDIVEWGVAAESMYRSCSAIGS